MTELPTRHLEPCPKCQGQMVFKDSDEFEGAVNLRCTKCWLRYDCNENHRATAAKLWNASPPQVSDEEPVCANCKGMIGDLAAGREPEELCDTCYEDSFAALRQPQVSAQPQVDEGHDWISVHKPTLDDLAAIGEIAEGALLSEKGWAEIGHAVWDHITIDAEVTDWSSAIRGKFYSGKPATDTQPVAGRCTCEVAFGQNEACPSHGIGTPWRAENPEADIRSLASPEGVEP